MKKVFLLIISIASFAARAQNLQTVIKTQAMDMSKALIKNDFTSFVKFMHPKLLEFSGGLSRLKDKMDSADYYKKQFGVSFKKILIGNPGPVIQYKGQLQCVVPETTDLETPMGLVSAETSLIALSTDQGKNWYFIDNLMYRAAKLKNELPDLSPNLNIPPQKAPVVTPLEKH